MRVKLDEDVPLRVRALLAEHGHEAETVREEGLGGASDAQVSWPTTRIRHDGTLGRLREHLLALIARGEVRIWQH